MSCPEETSEGRRNEGLSARLLKTRTVLISGEIDQDLAEDVIAHLLVLDGESHDPIRMVVTTPGGAVYPGYAIYDMVRFIASPVIALGAGYVASMGVPILLAAEKKNRVALPNTRFLLHQPRGGAVGQLQDIRIQAKEILSIREQINALIAQETGQNIDKVRKDTDRDFWMSAEEALEYGLISRIVKNAKDAVAK